MWDGIADTTLVALIGLIGGVMLGLAARIGRFCTLGAIEDMLYQRSTMRMRMWFIAIGTAILGAFGLMAAGLLVAEDTIYLSFVWNPLASIAGGLLFGYGMAMAGSCGFGALARLGGGDMRAFVIVLVMGISAYVTLSGPLALARTVLLPTPVLNGEPLPGIAQWLAANLGGSDIGYGLAIGAAILLAAGASRKFLARRRDIFWGVVVGLAIVSGWAGTQWVASNGFSALPVESHTYSAPIGDTLFYLMTSSGSTLNFGVGSVVGVLLGAFLGSVIKGHFRWEACEDPRELRRQIMGAVFMGVGAVVAFGCTIGQGVSAFSVLFFGAPVAFVAILGGAAFGLRQLITGFAAVK